MRIPAYLLIITLISLGSLELNAQATLQFNQVKLISSSESVPTGKVWKLTGIFTNQTSFGNHSVTETPAILVNGVRNHYVVPMPRGSGFFAYTVAGFPLWLPAGTSVAPSNKTFYINAVEFNVVPN